MAYIKISQRKLSSLLLIEEIRLTFETDGPGAFTEKDIEDIVRRDASGRVVERNLSKRIVIIANHQVRTLIHTIGSPRMPTTT